MMKRLALIFSFISAFSFAQTDVEEQGQESFVSIDSSKNLMTYDLRGIYQLAEKKCSNAEGHQFNSAKINLGEENFKQDLKKRINQYLNNDAYVANGPFYIDFLIDKDGKTTDIKVGPAIENSKYFYDDLKSAAKKVKTNWTPANCDGQAIPSTVRVKLLFDSLVIDNSQ